MILFTGTLETFGSLLASDDGEKRLIEKERIELKCERFEMENKYQEVL